MPTDSIATAALRRGAELNRRVELLQGAMEALENLIRQTPEGRAVPLPVRQALCDFDRELARLGGAAISCATAGARPGRR